jgi:hypothetical protein
MFCTHNRVRQETLLPHCVRNTQECDKVRIKPFFLQPVVSALFYQLYGLTTVMIHYSEHMHETTLKYLPSIKRKVYGTRFETKEFKIIYSVFRLLINFFHFFFI